MKSRLGTIIVFFIVLGLFLISMPLWAQDDCRGNRNCNQGSGGNGVTNNAGGSNVLDVTTDVSVDSPVSVSNSDSSRAYGFGLGDVDINDCYRSFQILMFQDSRANRWCMANDLDARGLHEAAAKMRCSLNAYEDIFEDHETCVAQSTVSVPVPVVAAPHDDEDDDDVHRELYMQYEMLREQMERIEQRPAVRREVIKKSGLSKEQKQALREVVK